MCDRTKEPSTPQPLADPPEATMTRERFRAWAKAQPRGRFERVEGVVVAMAPERVARLRIKGAVWLALRQAIAAAALPCEALPDGATVEVGEAADYEPDAVVNCGERLGPDTIALPNPVVVAEVLSPSTQSVDTGQKLFNHFRVPSIRHYLIVRTDRVAVIHHRRRDGEEGGVDTRIVTGGELALDPPGLRVSVEAFYAD